MAADGIRCEEERQLVQALSKVLLLHGGELPASVAGDEVRRRYAQVWRDWKCKVPDASLLRLCSAARQHGLCVENLEALDSAASTGREPVIRYEGSQDDTFAQEACMLDENEADLHSTEDALEQSEFLRSALVSRFGRHPNGPQGGAVPLGWLTIALEKELLRHIRCSDSIALQLVILSSQSTACCKDEASVLIGRLFACRFFSSVRAARPGHRPRAEVSAGGGVWRHGHFPDG